MRIHPATVLLFSDGLAEVARMPPGAAWGEA
jgi:hypothetical protein